MAETLIADEDLAAAPLAPLTQHIAPSVETAPRIPTEPRALVTRLQRILTERQWLMTSPPTSDMWFSTAAEALADARFAAHALVEVLEAM